MTPFGIRLAAIVFLFFCVFTEGCVNAQPAPTGVRDRPPNIIIIFADDQGYQDIGVFGATRFKTPNLDRMANEGRRFTSFYVAASVCSPSRAALLTGCYPPRVGITGVLFPRHSIGLNPEEITIADVLKQRGYATACIGKWHLGHLPEFLPTSNGFDSYFGIPYSNDMDGVKGKNRNLDRAWVQNDFNGWNVPLLRDTTEVERPADQKTLTRRYTEEAIQFIETNRKRPFFLYLPHTMPHIPLFVEGQFRGRSGGTPYGDTIEEIDWSVGRILETLNKLELDDQTLVIYTSDNGPWLNKKHHAGSALPLRDGKFSVYEGGMRVPCIMRWPGKIPARSNTNLVASTIDFLPTLAKLAGAKLPGDRLIDGKDIWPLMVGEDHATSPHEAYFFYKGTTLAAVRSGKWKLHLAKTRKQKKVPAELYDLSSDISETTNLATTHIEIVDRITNLATEFDMSLKKSQRPPGSVNTQ